MTRGVTGQAETTAGWMSSRTAWIFVLTLTLILSAFTAAADLRRYRNFETGWPWDLAYYNQWYWSLTRGDQILSVRPIAAYADEGPSVWKTNYVSPLRFALIPVHYLAPDPRTLLVVHAFLFWLILPASFTLTRSVSKSNVIALLGTLLVPVTPLIWPLAINDFREIQLALPFVLWGVQGARTRDVRVAMVGVAGMLACRQEMAVVVASLAFLKADKPEDIGVEFRWRHAFLLTGLVWIFFVFFGHLRYWAGPEVPINYLQQFGGPGAPLDQTLMTAAEILALGLGSWILLLVLAPRETALMLPWLWSLAHGKWAIRFLETQEWHHVRYAAPLVALGVSAGLVGFGEIASVRMRRKNGGKTLLLAWVVLLALSVTASLELRSRVRRQPRPIEASEVSRIWEAIAKVGPEDGVLACYEVAAPLSSRRNLVSYILPINQPRGYPTLPKGVRWVFYRNADGSTEVFQKQGFKVVHEGHFMTILTRP